MTYRLRLAATGIGMIAYAAATAYIALSFFLLGASEVAIAVKRP